MEPQNMWPSIMPKPGVKIKRIRIMVDEEFAFYMRNLKIFLPMLDPDLARYIL